VSVTREQPRVDISTTDRPITAWAGAVLIRQAAKAVGLSRTIGAHLHLSPDPPIDPRRAANGCYFEPEIHGGHATEGRRRPASTRAGPIVGRRTDPRRAEEPVDVAGRSG